MHEGLIGFLKMHDVEYRENVCLGEMSPIRIGGVADLVVYPQRVDLLISILRFLKENKIKYKILGRMSNVLAPDISYHSVVIRTDRLNNMRVSDSLVYVGCGCSMACIANFTAQNGLSGMEALSGIPGSIGGSIVGNAGAFGREISDLIANVFVYDIDRREVIELTRDECGFGYRRSDLGSQCVVLGAIFRLAISNSHSVYAEMARVRSLRIATQPTGIPSLGSTFRRVDDISAARLIDECGLKGHTVGGAQISVKHAGFIVNIGGAIAKDYINLSEYAAECVYSRFAVRLQREVEIL